VLAAADEISGVVGNNLREQRDRAVLNRQLNHLLTDVDLGVTLPDLVRGEIDAAAVKEVFSKLAFKSLKERVLLLAGSETGVEEMAALPVSSATMPKDQTTVDEELTQWLSSRKGEAIGVCVRHRRGRD